MDPSPRQEPLDVCRLPDVALRDSLFPNFDLLFKNSAEHGTFKIVRHWLVKQSQDCWRDIEQ